MTDRFSEVEAEAYVARTCFKTGPPQAVGIELEWLLHDARDPAMPVRREHLDTATAAGVPVRAGRLTLEPGGQLELSSKPFPDPVTCARAVTADLIALRSGLAERGLHISGTGLDPARPPRRLLDLPRYVAMERYFDRSGPTGRVMMCSTAAVQVNVDAGPERPGPREVDFRTRWAVLHELAPVLVAAFANSPFARGRPSGSRCRRQAVWAALDPGRTAPVRRPDDRDPRESWARYVLAAPVLCLPCEGPDWSVPEGLTFADWARGDGPRPATLTDLQYHLTTLFPPVRPRGHLEVRTIDAQRTDADWVAALALVWALVSDPAAADAARAAGEALAGVPDLARRAVADATADPALAGAAVACFAAAGPALDRLGAGELRPVLESYAERYPARGRCPADDALDHWRRTGSVHLPPAPRRAARHQGGRAVHDAVKAGDVGAGDVGAGDVGAADSRGGDRTGEVRAGDVGAGDLRERIAGHLERARARMLMLTSAVDDADLVRQHSPLMSPLVWDMTHIGNQEELWLLREVGGREPLLPDAVDQLYDAFRHPRAARPTLPLLDPAASRRYVHDVRGRVTDLLGTAPLDGAAGRTSRLTEGGFVFGMVAQHEQQHVETMLATHQLRDGERVLAEAPLAGVAPAAAEELPAEVLIPAGEFEMGTDVEPWALDNERPAHRAHVAAFHLDTVPVSNAAYARFVEAGGYADERLWHPDGWAHVQAAGLVAPQFWWREAGTWLRRRFGVVEEVPPQEPVQHVCWYEADAYARWAGRRLPAEAEWEKAARHDPASGRSRRYPWGDADPTPEVANLAWGPVTALRPAAVGAYPAGGSPYGVRQLIGDVWEWTAGDFTGYPGFAAYPYREYSEVFFGSRFKVLRGGSWAVDRVACRGTFRNWDYPIRRQIFAGFRTARDAAPVGPTAEPT